MSSSNYFESSQGEVAASAVGIETRDFLTPLITADVDTDVREQLLQAFEGTRLDPIITAFLVAESRDERQAMLNSNRLTLDRTGHGGENEAAFHLVNWGFEHLRQHQDENLTPSLILSTFAPADLRTDDAWINEREELRLTNTLLDYPQYYQPDPEVQVQFPPYPSTAAQRDLEDVTAPPEFGTVPNPQISLRSPDHSDSEEPDRRAQNVRDLSAADNQHSLLGKRSRPQQKRITKNPRLHQPRGNRSPSSPLPVKKPRVKRNLPGASTRSAWITGKVVDGLVVKPGEAPAGQQFLCPGFWVSGPNCVNRRQFRKDLKAHAQRCSFVNDENFGQRYRDFEHCGPYALPDIKALDKMGASGRGKAATRYRVRVGSGSSIPVACETCGQPKRDMSTDNCSRAGDEDEADDESQDSEFLSDGDDNGPDDGPGRGRQDDGNGGDDGAGHGLAQLVPIAAC